MDSMKAARIIGAINRAIGIMECHAPNDIDGGSSLMREAKRLEDEALKPLMEEYAKDE